MKKSRRSNRRIVNKYILACAFIAIVAIIIAATGMFVQANEKSNVIYESIEIEENDTLWSIATEYYDHDKESVNDYIKNIKDINSMSSDKIISGNYIIIYRYN